MFVTIGLGLYQNDKRFMHIDGKHFVFIGYSGMGKLAALELFRYAQAEDKEVQMMQPFDRGERLVWKTYVGMEIDDKDLEDESRISWIIKKSAKAAVKERAAAFVNPDSNVRKMAAALKEIDERAKEDNYNHKYRI